MMKYLKAFIAGLALPGTVAPLVFLSLHLIGRLDVVSSIPIYLVPLGWGFWNALYLWAAWCPLRSWKSGMFVYGGILGLIYALLGTFVFGMPALLGMPGLVGYFPLVLAPVAYALVWGYLVSYLNSMFGLEF